MKALHLLDTLYSLILCYTAFGMITATFILTGFFRGVPQELLDQAKIDGCSHWDIYARIMMPLARPAIATVTIFLFLSYWNELILALTFIQNDAAQDGSPGHGATSSANTKSNTARWRPPWSGPPSRY